MGSRSTFIKRYVKATDPGDIAQSSVLYSILLTKSVHVTYDNVFFLLQYSLAVSVTLWPGCNRFRQAFPLSSW